MNSLHLYRDFWDDSFRAVKRYIERNYIRLPCHINFFPHPDYPIRGLTINRYDRVKLSRDKVKMNKYFDKIGIPHPKTYYKNSRWLRFKSRFQKKRYIRKARFSYGGNGKKIFDRFPEFDSDKYYIQEFWPHPDHARVYYLEGKPIIWCALIGGKGEIRNYQYGWKYIDINKHPIETGNDCIECALNMWAEIIHIETELNFFAFDVAVNGAEYKILEMNAMPDIRRRFRIRPFVTELIKYAERYTSKRSENR